MLASFFLCVPFLPCPSCWLRRTEEAFIFAASPELVSCPWDGPSRGPSGEVISEPVRAFFTARILRISFSLDSGAGVEQRRSTIPIPDTRGSRPLHKLDEHRHRFQKAGGK